MSASDLRSKIYFLYLGSHNFYSLPSLKNLALDDNLLGSFTQADINFFDGLITTNNLKLKLGRYIFMNLSFITLTKVSLS